MAKIEVPKKTKIGIWLIKIGMIIIFFYSAGVIFSSVISEYGVLHGESGILWTIIFLICLISVLIFPFAHRLSKGEKKAWKASVGTSSFLVILIGIYVTWRCFSAIQGFQNCKYLAIEYHDLTVNYCKEFYFSLSRDVIIFFSFSAIFIVLPLILFFLDRKNYWKIAS